MRNDETKTNGPADTTEARATTSEPKPKVKKAAIPKFTGKRKAAKPAKSTKTAKPKKKAPATSAKSPRPSARARLAPLGRSSKS